MTRTDRLLLVEDDPRLGPLVADVLGEDWDVTLVTSGEDALDAAADRMYAVMVVDRRLPGIDGAEVVARLRRRRDATRCSCSRPSARSATGSPGSTPERTTTS